MKCTEKRVLMHSISHRILPDNIHLHGSEPASNSVQTPLKTVFPYYSFHYIPTSHFCIEFLIPDSIAMPGSTKCAFLEKIHHFPLAPIQ